MIKFAITLTQLKVAGKSLESHEKGTCQVSAL